jgi:putative AdoMet-dependent methyltransferase
MFNMMSIGSHKDRGRWPIMRSRFADAFNHDPYAAGYDNDVADETHPIREGYRQALAWLGSIVVGCTSILDLGTGTGNTIEVLPGDARIVAVDISRDMLEIAKSKCADRRIHFIESDLLEYFEEPIGAPFDAIVSAYTIHHLTDAEKNYLIDEMMKVVKPLGTAVIADLMYKDRSHKGKLIDRYATSHKDVVEGIQGEFYWDIERTRRALNRKDIGGSLRRFTDMNWGMILQFR